MNLQLDIMFKHISILILYIGLQRHQHVYPYDLRIATRNIQNAVDVYEVCSLWPKHAAAVSNKYCAKNCLWQLVCTGEMYWRCTGFKMFNFVPLLKNGWPIAKTRGVTSVTYSSKLFRFNVILSSESSVFSLL